MSYNDNSIATVIFLNVKFHLQYNYILIVLLRMPTFLKISWNIFEKKINLVFFFNWQFIIVTKCDMFNYMVFCLNIKT